MTTKLPPGLHSAYDWTDAASEIDTLRDLTGEALAAYCQYSAENASEHGHADVSTDDLRALHVWLTESAR